MGNYPPQPSKFEQEPSTPDLYQFIQDQPGFDSQLAEVLKSWLFGDPNTDIEKKTRERLLRIYKLAQGAGSAQGDLKTEQAASLKQAIESLNEDLKIVKDAKLSINKLK